MIAFIEEVILDHKLEGHKNKMQGLLEELQVRFEDLQKLKPCLQIHLTLL